MNAPARAAPAAIVLAAFNARYIHASLGLRCLLANLGAWRERAALEEFDLQCPPDRAAETILAHGPRIVGLGVHIWNVRQTAELTALLRAQCPGLTIVLGGPEIGAAPAEHPFADLADHVVCGEGDLAFAELCGRLLAGGSPPERIIRAPPPDPARLALPYAFYSDHDLATRLTYVETSRGCPFDCEYCLSAGDRPVRFFPLEPLLPELAELIRRGARRFKFVDRTFNFDIDRACRVLDFLGRHHRPGLQAHFELVPEILPETLRAEILRAPPGLLRFEVGVQTFDPEVAARIRRRLDPDRVEAHLRFLVHTARVEVHADLIAGLPGESLAGFAAGFDRLARIGPREIQLGILKRLRGTAIGRHDAEWGMEYVAEPPYQILRNRLLDAATLRELGHMARFWERIVNRGHFPAVAERVRAAPSPFGAFHEITRALLRRFGRSHAISRAELAEALGEECKI